MELAESRFQLLTDKKLEGGLTALEKNELREVEQLLDDAEAPAYAEFKQRLRAILKKTRNCRP